MQSAQESKGSPAIVDMPERLEADHQLLERITGDELLFASGNTITSMPVSLDGLLLH